MSRSLYRKYRPETFSEVVGQEHVEKTLMSAVANGKVSHAYLFCGPSGTGKTTTARLLAKALLCKSAPTDNPDGTCEHCRSIADGTHPDVYELDAASRTGVENVRDEIISRVQYAPTQGAYKIYIIDEVHMLSTAAFNALLKTLEEPPSHVVFMLCTTDPHKVIETIRARCQRFDFHRLSNEQIASRLAYICKQENYEADPRALELIAQRAIGKMRDAISSLEQVAVYGGGKINYEAVENMLGEVNDEQLFALTSVLAKGDAAGAFGWIANFVLSGTDIALLVADLSKHIRNLYITALTSTDEPLLELFEINASTLARYREQVREFNSSERISYVLSVLGDLNTELKSAPNARLAIEIACTRIVRPAGELSLMALAARVAELERKLQGGTPAIGTSGTVAASGSTGATANVEQNAAPNATASSPSELESQEQAFSRTGRSPQRPVSSPTVLANQEQAPASNTEQIAIGINQLWHQTKDAVKKESMRAGMMLDGTQVAIDKSGASFVVTLPAKAGFAKSILEEPENVKLVSDLLLKFGGKQFTVKYVLPSENEPNSLKPAEPNSTDSKRLTTANNVEKPTDSQLAKPLPAEHNSAEPKPAPFSEAEPQSAESQPADPHSTEESESKTTKQPISSVSKNESAKIEQAKSDLSENEIKDILAQSFGAGIKIQIEEQERNDY
ncbi:MAG: DNA polymerase III subunit gamma/tau [Coriobacteriales bacterium]|jgi:DNA polymerase-3 subunit gamma/tau|nr:DNA polymerase III subunit gamma/tau [Coriobacteriales bacterium]